MNVEGTGFLERDITRHTESNSLEDRRSLSLHRYLSRVSPGTGKPRFGQAQLHAISRTMDKENPLTVNHHNARGYDFNR